MSNLTDTIKVMSNLSPVTAGEWMDLYDLAEKLEAENQRLRMNLDAYKQAEELWCRQDERREAENKRLREALETISRLEPYDGNRHVYHTAGKVARKALAL